jgi:hypothetical protein
MRRSPAALFGATLLACAALAVSCSDSNDDPVGKACSVIVRDCGALSSMGECIDQVGYLDAECVLCIANADCNYFSDCQRSVPSCALSSDLEPPSK